MDNKDQAWFLFKVYDTGGVGVEIPKLTRLLERLSSAFLAVARAETGGSGSRRGRPTTAEEALVAFRLVRVTPGSIAIELAPPPSTQVPLPLFEEPSIDDVAFGFYREMDSITSGAPPAAERQHVRRRVQAVMESAADIGLIAEVEYRPRFEKPGVAVGTPLRARVPTRQIPRLISAGPSSIRKRRLSGHAYMVDVEPGRQRLRIKVPEGRDVTLEVGEPMIAKLGASLDHVVELEAEEELEGAIVTRRSVRSISVLPSSGPGSEFPPKTVDELANEQGVSGKRPDYVALASEIWTDEKELAEFLQHLQVIRRLPAG
jgi:hypothetical protein